MSLFRCGGGGQGASDLAGMYESVVDFYGSSEAEAQFDDLVVNGENAVRTSWGSSLTKDLSFGKLVSSSNNTTFTVTRDCELYFGIAGTNVNPNITNNAKRSMIYLNVFLGEFNVTTPVTTCYACFKAGDVLSLGTSGNGYVGFKVGVYGKAI